jgi:hypothetical protein
MIWKIIIYGHQEIWLFRASGNDFRDWTNPGGIEVGFGLSENPSKLICERTKDARGRWGDGL